MVNCKNQSHHSRTSISGYDFLADTFGRIALAENTTTKPGTSEAAIQQGGSEILNSGEYSER
ncbi:hypothetical protein E4U58_000614 [Claviceps cyperi]|nr:hypothetical protein E4U58_000614 [Claviceps cyperi]